MKIKTETDIRENTLISKTKYVFFPCVHFCVAHQSDKWLCYMKNDKLNIFSRPLKSIGFAVRKCFSS